jgi:[NiFe] hydrogenase assembly HybE family chaperone
VTRFEGSFLGDSGRIGDGALMECGVCWWVYDPALGDPVWHIPTGTPFAHLPAHWRCPNCDAAADQFMALEADTAAGEAARQRPSFDAGTTSLAARSRQLRDGYLQAAGAMRSLPVYNHLLEIEIVGMRRCDVGDVAIAATPWCMNIVLLARDGERRREGSSRDVAFPSGVYAFIAGHLPGFGAIETCSLFSPMQQFDDPAAVSAVAHEALVSLFRAQEAAQPQPISRRRFLRPGAAV